MRPTGRFAHVRSLDVKLLVLVWGVLLVVIVAYTWAASYEVREAAVAAANERLTRVTKELARAISNSNVSGLEEVASLPETLALLRDSAAPGAADTVHQHLVPLSSATTISITLRAAGGRTLVGVKGPLHDPVLDAHVSRLLGPSDPATLGAMATTSDVTRPTPADSPRLEPMRGPLTLADGKIYYDRGVTIEADGRVLGVIVERRLAAPLETGVAAIENLIGSDAVFLFGNAGGDLWTDLRSAVPGPEPRVIDADVAVSYDRDGVQRFGLGATIDGTPLAMLVEFPMATVVAPARAFVTRALAVGVILLVLGTAASIVLGRRLTAPLHHLADAAKAIASGDYSRRVSVAGNHEISALAGAFNRMAEEVENARGVDSSRRAEAELARNHSHEYFRALVESSLDIVAVVDRRNHLSFVSDSSQRHLGLEPGRLIHREIREVVHPDDWKAVERILGEAAPRGETREVQFRCQSASGEWRTLRGVSCDLRHNPVIDGVLFNLHDITQHLQLEDELRQSQKMEAVGRLAGGIAHDFNNLLTAMGGSLEFVRRDQDLSAAALDDLDSASAAAARAAELVRQLLAFGRQQAIEPTIVDPNAVILNISHMLGRLVGEHIQVNSDLDPDIHRIRVDRNQLEQVLLNLAVNARDAMGDGGTLLLTTTSEQTESGPLVLISVSDTGTGMDEATKRRAFEPFFTTKAEDVGTGLGLATVYGIMSQSGASIEVESELGRGTTFDLIFPGVAAAVDREPLALPQSANVAPVSCGSVLVVEDQDQVASLVTRALTARGLDVRLARSVKEAMDTLAESDASFDLLLTDVGLPDGRGPELTDAAHALHPGLKVLLMTGYDRLRVEAGLGYPVLEKPFTLDQLGEAVDELLAGADRATPGLGAGTAVEIAP